MTLDELRRAVALLPEGASLTLSCAELRAALATGAPASPAAEPTTSDELLTVDVVAMRLGVSARWCYDHSDVLGVKRLSRRCIRFSARAVEKYASRSTRRAP